MDKKRHLKKFENQSTYESQKDSVMGMPYVVLVNDTKEVLYSTYNDYYLCFESIENTSYSLHIGSAFTETIETYASLYYSIDGCNTWTLLPMNMEENITYSTPIIEKGKRIYWKGDFDFERNQYTPRLKGTDKFSIKGNIMSLVYGDDFKDKLEIKEYQFCYLFSDNQNLISTKNLILPSKKLSNSCYRHMFNGCANLVEVPQLPATELSYRCYNGMFWGCTSLTKAPKLIAEKIDEACYGSMFADCTSLIEAPELPATTLASHCYHYMFQNCTSLTKAPELPALNLAHNCYYSMFDGCTSLTKAPKLPATTLAQGCYNGMFYGCISLTKAPELPATTLEIECYDWMFRGCSSLVESPILKAPILTNYCYRSMLRDCTSLKKITMLATDISATSCLGNWVNGVASSGTFVKHPDMTSLPSGKNGIPEGWTVENAELI